MSVRVKICGVRRVEDALAAADAGADAIGVNFAPESPRRVSVEEARSIAEAVRGRLLVVGVFVNATLEEIAEIDARVGLNRLQLHGEEPPELVGRFAGRAYKAIRIASAADLEALARYPGPCFLLDAHASLARGGTGRSFDWALAKAARRYGRIVLAGGLTPENVTEAVRSAEPYAVDVASGVEQSPGVKDAGKIAEFIRAARSGDPSHES